MQLEDTYMFMWTEKIIWRSVRWRSLEFVSDTCDDADADADDGNDDNFMLCLLWNELRQTLKMYDVDAGRDGDGEDDVFYLFCKVWHFVEMNRVNVHI